MTSELHEMNTNDTKPPFDSITETPNDSTPPMFDVPPQTSNVTVPTNDVTTLMTPHHSLMALHQYVTPPHNQSSQFQDQKQSERTKVLYPQSHKAAKKQTSGSVALYCKCNPENLAATIMQRNYWLTDKHIDHAQCLISRQFSTVKRFHCVGI